MSSVSRNATINLLGAVIPLFVTLVTIPPYLRVIGTVRFGVLSLVWLFLSYFGLFEMGLGRATSKYIAELAGDSQGARQAVFWTAAFVNVVVGAVGGLLLWIVARSTLPLWLKSDATMQTEVARALPWLALAVPVATVTSVLVGALEGCEEFAVLNFQQVGATVVFQVVPLLVAYWIGPRVDWLIAAAVLARMGANLPLLISCARCLPLRGLPSIDRSWIRRLLGYGTWITISGIVSPILTSLDRFVIGFAQGAQAVTYYAIPYNFATKLWILPSSLQRALFPRFSSQPSAEAQEMASRSVLALAGILTPIVVIAILGTGPFFRFWIGAAAATRCTRAGELMLLGVWINSLSWVPYGLLQAQGRPNLTAKLHLFELLPFVGLLWLGIHFGGVAGAAAIWCVRVATDGAFLFIAAGIVRGVLIRLVPSTVLVSLAFAFSLAVGDHIVARVALAAGLGMAAVFAAHTTSPDVARALSGRIRTIFKRGELVTLGGTGE
jgi:O-antigen/teichoic acid export membrane protein